MSQCSSCKWFHVPPTIHRCYKKLEATREDRLDLDDDKAETVTSYLGRPKAGDGKCTEFEAYEMPGAELEARS